MSADRQSATHRFFIGKAEKLRQGPSLINLMFTDYTQMVSIGKIPVVMEPSVKLGSCLNQKP